MTSKREKLKRHHKVQANDKRKRRIESRIQHLYTRLVKLFPKARKLTVFHLTAALAQSCKHFVTDDPVILKHAAVIQEKFHIKVCKSIYETTRYEDEVAKFYAPNRFTI